MKQIWLSHIVCLSAMLTSVSSQAQEWNSGALINGIAYRLEVYDADCEGAAALTSAIVIALSEVTEENERYSGDIIIPDKVEYKGYSYEVVGFDSLCFADCEELRSVTFPNLSTILGNTFKNCPNLTKIDLGNETRGWFVGSHGISDCPNLKELILPCGMGEFKNNAIEASGLETFILPKRIKYIGGEALSLPSLKELVCYQENPNKIEIRGANPFGSGESGINLKKCTLRVPAASVEAYKSAYWWKNFGQILPIEDVGIAAPEVEAEVVEAFDLLGRPASGKGVRIVNGKKTLVR